MTGIGIEEERGVIAPVNEIAPAPAWEAAAAGAGPIMAIGGAEDKLRDKLILATFVQLAGGRDARIGIVPTASSIEMAGERYKALFLALGADDVEVILLANRDDANSDAAVELLQDATGIFLTGGNQMRLASIVGGTRVARLVLERNHNGAVVAGTSAGASILSSHMVAFGQSGPTPRMRMAQMVAGFGLVPNVIVDQHFRQRDRIGRLLALVAASPSLLGVGIDEDTAAVFGANGLVDVIGRNSVTIVDGSRMYSDVFQVKRYDGITVSNAILHVLTAGHRFDLATRQLVRT
ncbi:MAG TPA: cyanophycinase [Thermomicrobiales bacterium]|nr:cyanophycinase [Thermomicrobiales bacterium]